MKDAILKIIEEVESSNPFEVTNTDVNTYFAWKEACDAMCIKLHGYDPWVSVEDRLPEIIEGSQESLEVLTYVPGLGVYITYVSTHEGQPEWMRLFVGDRVTHWMPLPDTPQPLK